jgi:hypothetical protein
MKQKTLWLLVSFCVLVVLGVGWYRYVSLQIQVSAARGQIEVFTAMREKALAGNTQTAVDCLSYMVAYYQPGTKQPVGSAVSHMVETCRRFAIADVIRELQKKTGQDLGSDPTVWISNRSLLEAQPP